MQQKSNRYDSVKNRKNKPQLLQLQYASQPKQPKPPAPGNFQVANVDQGSIALIQNYVEMINQETDIYYLFDCFHQLLNSIKQAQEGISAKKVNQSSRQNTIDWWKLTGSSSWTGMKNLQQLQESHLKQSSSRFNESYNSRGSAIIEGLKRQIGELTDEQKFKQNCRMIGTVPVQLFSENDFEIEMNKDGRKLLTIYQLQNRFHKCHMGFCLYQSKGQEREKDVLIKMMYIAKCYRKNENYFTLVKEFLRHLIEVVGANTVKIKVNSTQGALIKQLLQFGFKLSTQLPLVSDLRILTLLLLRKDFK